MVSPERVRELHRENHRRRRREIEAMTPLERMEEAYRLFTLVREEGDG